MISGDVALRQVAQRLTGQIDDDAVIGRYGPDEFLVIVDGPNVATLESAIKRLQIALAQDALEIESSERLPITVSAAISVYPTDAESATALVATAVHTLAEAKASGGDTVRVTGRLPILSADARAFDVFQGLILAVDTKDRYTKRHSEDVARYAVFLARYLELDAETIGTIRVAGLLHDVGKIGIPDDILRKPGKLTADESRVVKQHVALGDLIVRDLPNVETIRAGVRHHHERWDGRGYLDALAGDDIPLVARILAIGDAFSAMTTTRPYRKALGIDEALGGSRTRQAPSSTRPWSRCSSTACGPRPTRHFRARPRRGSRFGSRPAALLEQRHGTSAPAGRCRSGHLRGVGCDRRCRGRGCGVAATGGWTIASAPPAIVQGIPTNIVLTATNISGGSSVGCVHLQLPGAFAVSSVAVDAVPPAHAWTADATFGGPAGSTIVQVHAVTEGDVLKGDGDTVVFHVTVTGTGPGYVWPADSRDHANCTSGSIPTR